MMRPTRHRLAPLSSQGVSPLPAPARRAPTPDAGTLGGRAEERQQAYQDVLDAIVLTPETTPHAYARVRARQHELQEWFAQHAGWRLAAGPTFARLIKSPDRTTPGMGAPGERDLDAREYAYACWTLWYSERSGRDQTTLTILAQEIAAQAATAAGSGYCDWSDREHRAAFVRALQMLVRHGWLLRLDGAESPYVETGEGDVLYEYTPLASYAPVLLSEETHAQVIVSHAWEAIDRLPDVDRDPHVRTFRQLLLTSAIVAAADPDLYAWAAAHVRDLRREFSERFAWRLEITAGHVAVLRPTQQAEWHGAFPTSATEMALPLLLSTRLREAMQAGAIHRTGRNIGDVRSTLTTASPTGASAASGRDDESDTLPSPDAATIAGGSESESELALGDDMNVLTNAVHHAATDAITLSFTTLRTLCSQIRREFGGNWSMELRRLSERELADRTMHLLLRWHLADGPDDTGQVRLFPTLGRYAGLYRQDGLGLGSQTEVGVIGDASADDEPVEDDTGSSAGLDVAAR